MIRCKECRNLTELGEPTGLFETFKIWIDIENHRRKDIESAKKVCFDCYEKLKQKEK